MAGSIPPGTAYNTGAYLEDTVTQPADPANPQEPETPNTPTPWVPSDV